MIFSILIPVYNVDSYLCPCLESIMCQSEQDFEIVLVDDGSTDNSAKICDEYSTRFPNQIKVIHQQNNGTFFSRRVAVKNACGEYFFFVDADDYLHPDALRIAKRKIDQFQCDLLIFRYAMVDHNRILLNEGPILFANETVFEGRKKNELYGLFIQGDNLNSLGLKIIRKSIFDYDTNYTKSDFIKRGEDLLQSLPIVTNACKVVYIRDILYYYNRGNLSSVTHSATSGFYDCNRYVTCKIADYMEKWEMTDIENQTLLDIKILNLIDQSLRPCIPFGYHYDKNTRSTLPFKIRNDSFFIGAYQNKSALHALRIRQRIGFFLLSKGYFRTMLPYLFVRRILGKLKALLGGVSCVAKKRS